MISIRKTTMKIRACAEDYLPNVLRYICNFNPRSFKRGQIEQYHFSNVHFLASRRRYSVSLGMVFVLELDSNCQVVELLLWYSMFCMRMVWLLALVEKEHFDATNAKAVVSTM